MNTLLLDTDLWDLVANANGNIAMATEPYALAQDVASACRTFLSEVWYDTTLGIPYLQNILGKTPPLSVFKGYLEAAALTVPDVVSATAVIETFNAPNRTVTGQIQFIDVNGKTGTVQI